MGLLLQSSCRMVLFQLSVLLMLASTHSHPHKRQADDMDHGDMNMAGEEECCDQKMVGEDRYFNIGYDHNGMTFDLNCLSPCIFEKEDQPGSKYCFAAGDMKVECEDDMDYTPTNRPRPTGEMTEGPDGETDGITDDGMTEDPNGVTGGTCKCGMKKTTRIVGGSETEVNEYPWIASFDFSGVNGQNPGGCAATLIANNWAVSASHCFFDPATGERSVYADSMSLVLGVHDRTGGTDSNRKVLAIEEIILHPSYVYTGNSYDIALFKLAESVDLDVWSPACLPDQGADYTGQNGWVYGWGVTSENGANLADKLLELEVPIVSDSVCASAMSSVSIGITSDMLCAGGEDGKDACGGDSGGPFTVADSQSGAHSLVGAVSFGYGCAREGLYGVYADVPFFRTWIDEQIAAKGGATFCS